MTTPSADQIFAYCASATFALMAGFERFKALRTKKKTDQENAVVSDAKRLEERANLMAKMADDYKLLLEKEYTAHQATRDYWHAKANDFQAELAKCNENCADLKSKTDISKIEHLILEQYKILQPIAQGINKLLEVHVKHS